MNFTPDMIRNAAFPLTTNGYNPQQVDKTLDRIADQLAEAARVDADVLLASFETVSAGYDVEQVAEFFASMRRALPAVASPAVGDGDGDEADPKIVQEEPTVSDTTDFDGEDMGDVGVDGSGPLAADNESSASDGAAASSDETVAILTLATASDQADPATFAGTLPGAVERTKLAVSQLEAFAASQMEQAKSALVSQIEATEADCMRTLQTAQGVSDEALGETRQRAEAVLEQATGTVEQVRTQFQAQLRDLQARFDHDLERSLEAVRDDVRRLIQEATQLNRETHAHVETLHQQVHTSLHEARSVLSPGADRLAA